MLYKRLNNPLKFLACIPNGIASLILSRPSAGEIRKPVCILLAALMLVMPFGGFPAYAETSTNDGSTNLVLNPSFETGLTKPESWTFSIGSTGSLGTWAWDTDKHYDGQKSVKLTTTSATDRAVFYQQYIAIQPATKYALSTFYCANNSQVQPIITISWYTDQKVLITGITMNGAKGKTDWAILELAADSPANAAFAYISVQIARSAAGNVWFDMAQFTEVPPVEVTHSYNLAVNPGFESGSGQPDNWTFTIGSATPGTWNWDTSIKYKGEKSIRLTTINTTDRAVFYQQYIPVTPGQLYNYSVHYLTENMNGQPFITIAWYSTASTSGLIQPAATVNCIKDASEWNQAVFEGVSPVNAHYAYISVQTKGGAGSVWFDNVCLKEIKITENPSTAQTGVLNAGFEEGTSSPDNWQFINDDTSGSYEWDGIDKYSGSKSVNLFVYGENDTAYIFQKDIGAAGGKSYDIKAFYKTGNSGALQYMKVYWYDINGAYLSSSCVEAAQSTEWSMLSLKVKAPAGTVKFALQFGIENGNGKVWFDDITVEQVLLNYNGTVIPVNGVEDICEPMMPSDFWAEMPVNTLIPPTDLIWTKDFFRNFFFGATSFQTPTNTDALDNLPIVGNTVGVPVGDSPARAIAGDIQYNPIVIKSAHTGNYYPKLQTDYTRGYYNPSYIYTGNIGYLTRMMELMDFLNLSRWTVLGANAFVSAYYPSEYSEHTEWKYGWDYQFDGTWTDAFGYTFQQHSPDHHVNSEIASGYVNSYELTGDLSYWQAAKDFVYNQIPRYGFHKGVWNNETYYWTEYNESGASQGNPINDSVDNVNAYIAEAVAKVAYYETDQTMKNQLLEFARGLLWYMVREYSTDGRWYYFGAESALNGTTISHESVCISRSMLALAYLYKSGMDISSLTRVFSGVYEHYLNIWPTYQWNKYLKMFKIYDGIPAPNTKLTFTTFAQVTSRGLSNVKFQDTISGNDFVAPATLDLRISGLIPPDSSNPDWRIDPDKDAVLSVTPMQLENGVVIPFSLNQWDVCKISYDLTAKSTFVRESAEDFDSTLSAWYLDSENNATFIRSSSGIYGAVTKHGATLPLNRSFTINSANFMSFLARLWFPFNDEMSAVLVTSPAPAASAYESDSDWGKVFAAKYIYPVQSLLPLAASSGGTFTDQNYVDCGKEFQTRTEGSYVELNFEVFTPTAEFKVLTNYIAKRNGGVVRLYIDGVQQGNDYDQYIDNYNGVAVKDIDQGILRLQKGVHTLKFETTGRTNPYGTNYIGLYDAIVLQPTAPILNDDANLAALSVENQAVASFSPDKLDYSVKLPYRSMPAPIVSALAKDSNASVKITQAGELPGTAVVSVVAEDGITTNNYEIEFTFEDPTIESIRSLVDMYSKDGSITGPLIPQLTNSLDHAKQHLDKGDASKAVKHIDNFLKHLNNPDMSEYITGQAKGSLEIEAEALIEFLLK